MIMDQMIDLKPGQYLQVTDQVVDDNGGLPYCKTVAKELGLKYKRFEANYTILLKPVYYHRFTNRNVSPNVSI